MKTPETHFLDMPHSDRNMMRDSMLTWNELSSIHPANIEIAFEGQTMDNLYQELTIVNDRIKTLINGDTSEIKMMFDLVYLSQLMKKVIDLEHSFNRQTKKVTYLSDESNHHGSNWKYRNDETTLNRKRVQTEVLAGVDYEEVQDISLQVNQTLQKFSEAYTSFAKKYPQEFKNLSAIFEKHQTENRTN